MSPALAGGLFTTEPSEKLMAFFLNDLDTDSFHLVLCHDLGSWNPLHTADRKEKKVENPASSKPRTVTIIISTVITLVNSSLMTTLKYKGCWKCL